MHSSTRILFDWLHTTDEANYILLGLICLGTSLGQQPNQIPMQITCEGCNLNPSHDWFLTKTLQYRPTWSASMYINQEVYTAGSQGSFWVRFHAWVWSSVTMQSASFVFDGWGVDCHISLVTLVCFAGVPLAWVAWIRSEARWSKSTRSAFYDCLQYYAMEYTL